MSIKQKMQRNFIAIGDFAYRYPKRVLAISLMVAVIFCASLGSLRIDTSTESNLDANHPEALNYQAFHELYGFEEAAVLIVKTDKLFDLTFLQKLAKFHAQLEQEVVLLGSIKSMVSSSLIYGADDDLIVEDLLMSFPKTEVELQAFKQRVLDNTLFHDTFVSRNGQYTSLYLYQKAHSPTLLNGKKQAFTSVDQHHFMKSIRAVIAEYQADNFDITISGGPMIGDTLLTKIAEETPLFTALSNLIIIILLYSLFRRVSAVVLPLLVVNISLVSLFGLMAHCDIALSSFSQILPSFILTVGVCDSVHFLSIFYQRYEQHQNKKLAIEEALGHTGIPMMLTSLTTAVGMLSFAFTEIVPIRSLGLFAAAGVVIVWFYTIILLPALLTLLKINTEKKGTQVLAKSQRFLNQCGQLGWNHPYKVVFIFGLLLLIAIVAVSQLRFQHDPVQWLPQDSELGQSIKLLNEEFYGAIAIEVLLDTGVENGVKSTTFLNKLDQLNTLGKTYQDNGVKLGTSRSIVDTVKLVHLGLNNNQAEFFSVPEDDELVAQEILLFEMSGGSDLETMVNNDFSIARVTMLGPWRDLIAYAGFIEGLELHIREIVGDSAKATFTGAVYLMSPIQKMAIQTMSNSYILSALLITIMMILMLGSFSLGLVSMIPNLLPIIVGMGFMYVTGFALDLYSILIGSIAIGLVVDDTVHFLHNFQRVYKETGDAELAVTETLNSTGNALLFTTILLFGGFMTYSLSGLTSLSEFGMITGFIIILALISDIVLLPALLKLMYSRKTQVAKPSTR